MEDKKGKYCKHIETGEIRTWLPIMKNSAFWKDCDGPEDNEPAIQTVQLTSPTEEAPEQPEPLFEAINTDASEFSGGVSSESEPND